MRIYTEVNFNWDDKQGNYVETSSKSFDYHGEVALCDEWKTWETRWYDTAGTVYKIKVRLSGVGPNPVKDRRISRSTDGGKTWENDWKKAETNVKKSEAHRWFKREVELFGVGKQAHENADAAKAFFFNTYGFEASGDTTENTTFMEGTKDTDFTEGKFTGTRPEWAPVLDVDDGGVDDIYALTDPDEINRREKVVDSLKGLVENWKDILDKGRVDKWQTAIEAAGKEVGHAAEDLENTYGDIADEYTDATEDMDEAVDRLTGKEGTYTTGIQDALDQFDKDYTAAERAETEGLEGTVTTREEEFETIQEKLGADVRTAEAKGGATGFVGAGVGQSARDILSRQFAKEALKSEKGFIEKRGDVREIQDIAEGDAEDIRDLKIRDLETTKRTDLSDYTTIRDDAVEAKEDLWETASTDYARKLEKYRGTPGSGSGKGGATIEGFTDYSGYTGGTIQAQQHLAKSALRQIQIDMEDLITGYRQDPTRDDKDKFADWSPFQFKGFLEGEEAQYGWEGGIFAAGTAESIFEAAGQTFTDYAPDAAEFTYDPTYVTSLLNPEEEDDDLTLDF